MTDDALPRVYLITPPTIDLDTFPARLAEVFAAYDIACLRIALATEDEQSLIKATDAIREVAHPHDVPLVIARHVGLAERLGLDGVHLDGARGVRDARKALGSDAIVGAYCGASRHDGLNAAEAEADYVAFGPVGETGLGDGTQAPIDLFQWWSEMIEVPVVAEGAITPDNVGTLITLTDFVGLGAEFWASDDPAKDFQPLLQMR